MVKDNGDDRWQKYGHSRQRQMSFLCRRRQPRASADPSMQVIRARCCWIDGSSGGSGLASGRFHGVRETLLRGGWSGPLAAEEWWNCQPEQASATRRTLFCPLPTEAGVASSLK